MYRKIWISVMGMFTLGSASATQPGWWGDRGALNGSPANDHAAVAQGQLKHFTRKAIEEMNARFPEGAGDELNGILENWLQEYQNGGHSPDNPVAADMKVMSIGQLKWIASKIRARLIYYQYQETLSWLPSTPPSTPAPADKNVANLGQLKTVFNFDLTAPAGQLPLWWQKYYFGGSTGLVPGADADGDGLSNLDEYGHGTTPSAADGDDDGVLDAVELSSGRDPHLKDNLKLHLDVSVL